MLFSSGVKTFLKDYFFSCWFVRPDSKNAWNDKSCLTPAEQTQPIYRAVSYLPNIKEICLFFLPRIWGRVICRPVCTSHTGPCLRLWHPELSGSDDSLFRKQRQRLKVSRNHVQPTVQRSAALRWLWRGQRSPQESYANSNRTQSFNMSWKIKAPGSRVVVDERFGFI